MKIPNKYYDTNTWKSMVKHCGDREIILFGAGTSVLTVVKIMCNIGKKVSAIIDNDFKKWGTFVENIEIINPELITNNKNVFIFIISQHGTKIGEQLESYGFKENLDYVDAYETVFRFLKLDKYIQRTEKFCDFIKSIDKYDFTTLPKKNSKKIGIVMIPGIRGHMGWYSLAIFLAMKYFGYNVTLIIDELTNIEDAVIYQGVTEDLKSITAIVIKELEDKLGKINIIYVRDCVEGKLSDYESEQIKKLAVINARWQKSRWDRLSRSTTEEEFSIMFEPILRNNMLSIKASLEKESFDVIDVHAGIHKQRGLYMLYGSQNNIRVSTYDGYAHSTDKPCDYQYDVLKLLNHQWFSEDEKKIILEEAKKHFKERLNSTTSDNICEAKYQLTTQKNEILQYDIIIPLNIMWDAAVLGIEDVFSEPDIWLDETLKFILKNTDATVMIRQHPAQYFFKDYYYEDSLGIILNKYKSEKRIRIVLAYEKINTYQCINKCKLVLPYSSTVGIESVLLKKPIITHTNCYYSYRNFGNKARKKEDYFNKIVDVLENRLLVSNEQMNDALLVYAMAFNAYLDFDTDFVILKESWLNYKFNDFIQNEYVKLITNVIGEDIPLAYQNIVKKWLD